MAKQPPHERPEARAAVAERRRQALALRRSGMTYDQIATELDYADRAGAYKAVMAAAATAESELAGDAVEMVKAETAELEAERQVCWDIISGPGTHVEVVKDDDGGTDVVTTEIPQDPDVVLRAIGQLNKINARIAALHGLDQPAKVHADTSVRVEIVGVDMSKLK